MQENFINVGMRKIFCALRINFRYTMKRTLKQNPREFWRKLRVSKILWMISLRSVRKICAVLPTTKSVMRSDNTTENGRIPRKLLCGFIMLHLRHSLFWILKFQGKKHCFNWRNGTVRWQKMSSVIHALPGIFSPVLRNMNNRHRRGNCRKNYNLRKNNL